MGNHGLEKVSGGLGLQNEALGSGSEQLLLQSDGLRPGNERLRLRSDAVGLGRGGLMLWSERVRVAGGAVVLWSNGGRPEGERLWGSVQTAVEAGALQVARPSRSRGKTLIIKIQARRDLGSLAPGYYLLPLSGLL